MSSSFIRRRVPGTAIRRWLGRGALVISLCLLPQVVVPADYDSSAQAQSPAARKQLEDRPDAKIDKTGVLKPGTSKAPKDKAAPAARKTRERLKDATWPKAGKASAEVTASGEAIVAVGGLGVMLAQEPAPPALKLGPKGAAVKATGEAEEVELSVHSQSAAEKAGVNGVLLTVAPTGGASGNSAQDTDKLRVSLDYSSFSDVYGGNFGPRLSLVTLPACALTTPQKKSCRTQRPLAGANNDAESQILTGAVSARALATGAPVLLAAAADSTGGGGTTAPPRYRLPRPGRAAAARGTSPGTTRYGSLRRQLARLQTCPSRTTPLRLTAARPERTTRPPWSAKASQSPSPTSSANTVPVRKTARPAKATCAGSTPMPPWFSTARLSNL